MRNCWARALGNCGGGMSGEHIVSGSLFTNESVTVHGFDWCSEAPKTIGLGSLKTKNLCANHNSRLSPVDAVGAEAFRTIRSARELAEMRGRSLTPWKRGKRLAIDGPDFEKWLFKTLVNVLSAERNALEWALDGTRLPDVPKRLVEWAYAREGFLAFPAGLYGAASVGQFESHDDLLQFTPVLDSTRRLAGVHVNFGGTRLLLNLRENERPSRHDVIATGVSFPIDDAPFRLGRVNWQVEGKLSHYIHFMWPPKATLRTRGYGYSEGAFWTSKKVPG